MAEIISISLNKEMLDDIAFIKKELGFSGRSEIIRAGLRSLLDEHKTLTTMKGNIEGTLIVNHKEEYSDEFSKIKHSLHITLVKTHIHHELDNHNCMEILLFKGDAEKIKKLYNLFLRSKKIDSVKIVIN